MSKAHWTVLYLCLYLAFISAAEDEDLIVCPPKVGCLRGTTMNGYQKGPFEAFMGIPYAEPPVGTLRFQSPKIKARWFNTYDATKFKSDCIQKNYLVPNSKVIGSENCLYLNIYRPKVRLGRLPVMIYIHGGGFFSGSANPKDTGPEYIMDTQSVILVTMSYRLGALGFLSTGDSNMPGNFGLKDQNLVFLWVRHNINSFDGDNKKITIFGHSTGAAATHMHLINPYSKNLFHRVISMSGTANAPFAITKNPLEQARETAKLCAIPNADTLSTDELTEALRNVNAKTLINAGGHPLTLYRPVVEPPSIDAIIPADPEILMKSVYFQKRPWLLGTVPQEGAVRAINIIENPKLREKFNLRFKFYLDKLLEWPNRITRRQARDKTEIVISQYFDGIYLIKNQTEAGFLDTITDRVFKHPLYEAIYEYWKIPGGKFPHYMYSFNYKGPFSYASRFSTANVTGKYGVVHGDDLIYLFRSRHLFPDFHKSSVEAKVIEKFVKYIVNFATFGYTVDVPPIGFCGTDVLDSRPHGICDYHEFVNNDDIHEGFEVVVKSDFPTEKVKLWQKLLD
ncbi:uncharacterized protein Dwil_GK21859 [Drosophila willistoni]|uniref:juvenile hormone esterase n=1 Tax=Drosophila willistoni TaxID=7260 RepID=UPI0007329945|nr:juvenile hormone esterase [Drosophila willistoni]EDW74339.2 uncharacterized protein Dwil_GK21859 [Drosophila willistoni]